jgi:hypothetical protein
MMEIFGIPVIFVVLFAILVLKNYAQEQQKEKEEITQKWDAINIGMGVKDVFEQLGKPNRVAKMGVQEAWGYGPNRSDGEIMFVEGRVVGYQKPSCTVDVYAGQSPETVTSDVCDGSAPEMDTNNTTNGQSHNAKETISSLLHQISSLFWIILVCGFISLIILAIEWISY